MSKPTSLVQLKGMPTNLIDTSKMSRSEWLTLRKGIIGASDVSAVLGISPWSSPWKLWLEKRSAVVEEKDSEVLRWGKYLEHAIVPRFMDDTGLKVIAEQCLAIHPENARAGATLDGLVTDDEAVLGPLEIKTGYLSKWEEQIPLHYQAQGQWQLYVSDQEVTHFAVFEDRFSPLYIVELKRDQSDIDFMLEEVEAFLQLVDSGTPPKADGSEATVNAMKSYWNKSVEKKRVDISHLSDTVVEFRKTKATIKELNDLLKEQEKKETGYKAKIIEAIQDAEIACIGDEDVFTFKSSDTTRSKKASEILQMYPRAGRKLVTTTPTRTLRDCASKIKRINHEY